MKNNFSLLIVDDHSVVRQGASLSLKKHFPGITIYNASDFEQTIDVLEQTPSVDLVLLDINIPGGNSTDMIAQIRALRDEIKILIFSAYEEQHYAMRYIRAGANGYLNKNGEEEEIISAVSEVLSKGEYVSEELRDIIKELDKKKVNPLEELSERELEIAKLLVDGVTNLEISNRLNIHMSTVSTYKMRIFKKLDIDNVVCLADIYRLYANS